MIRWLFLALLGLLAACDRGPECETSANCPSGEVCNADGACQIMACRSSTSCAIGEYCDPEIGQCTAGCLNDRDCLPTLACDSEQRRCIEPGCRSTTLDCSFGQFCNVLSGDCYDAGGYFCEPCVSPGDCGTASNLCLRLGPYGNTFCGVDCSAGQECPRGYECARIRTTGNTTLGYQCIAACWDLQR